MSAQNARIASLEEEVLLKEDALRAQADELDSLRRQLRAEESAKRELIASEQLARAQHKTAVGDAKDLQMLVESLRRELQAAELTATTEREAKRHVEEQGEAWRQQLQEATSKAATQAMEQLEFKEAKERAEAARALAEADLHQIRKEGDASRALAVNEAREEVAELKRQLSELKLQLTTSQQLAQEQAASVALLGEQTRRDEAELAARAAQIGSMSTLLKQVQADKQAAASQLVGASREAWEQELEARLQGEQLEALEHRHSFLQGELEARGERLRRAEEELLQVRQSMRAQQVVLAETEHNVTRVRTIELPALKDELRREQSHAASADARLAVTAARSNAPTPPQISTDSNRNPFVEWTNHNIQRAMIIRALVRQVDQSVHLARNQDVCGV